MGSILGKGTTGTWVGFAESEKELTAALFRGAEVKLWEIPFTAGGIDWGDGWGRRWVTVLEEEILIGRRQRSLGEISIDMFVHDVTHWEWEGQLVPHCG